MRHFARVFQKNATNDSAAGAGRFGRRPRPDLLPAAAVQRIALQRRPGATPGAHLARHRRLPRGGAAAAAAPRPPRRGGHRRAGLVPARAPQEPLLQEPQDRPGAGQGELEAQRRGAGVPARG